MGLHSFLTCFLHLIKALCPTLGAKIKIGHACGALLKGESL